jgi:DNA-binding response OmpR family regulator
MEVLLVEDDVELSRQMVAELKEDGHRVHVEHCGAGGLERAVRGGWDVIILDVTLPGVSGFELVERIRTRLLDVPVLFLTARSDGSDRVRGLMLGGDDYLTKPFSMDELKARLRVVERRRSRHVGTKGAMPDGWELNPLLRQVVVAGTSVALQPREWSLLELFLRHQGEVLSKSFLLDRVWGIRFDPGTNVVDAVVCRLRRKLDRPGRSSHVETLRGRGYVFHRDV